jgi:hypothetical protein
MAAVAYFILQQRIIRSQGPQSVLHTAIGSDWKGKLSPFLYLIAIPSALQWPVVAGVIYAGVAVIWLVPDARIERMVAAKKERSA